MPRRTLRATLSGLTASVLLSGCGVGAASGADPSSGPVVDVFLLLAVLAAVAVVGKFVLDARRRTRGADREIDEYVSGHPGQEPDAATRRAFRKYRSHWSIPPAGHEERVKRLEQARREGRKPETLDDPLEFTLYAPDFGQWRELYRQAPKLYSGEGVRPAGETTDYSGNSASSPGPGL